MIQLTLIDNTLFIRPYQDWMEEVLVCKRTVTERTYKGLKWITEEEPFFFLEEASNIATAPSGITHKLEEAVKLRGLPYNKTDKRRKALLHSADLREDRIQSLREYQDDIIYKVLTEREGIIKGATALGKSYCIRQLGRALPEENILITTKKLSVLRQIHKDLSDNEVDSRMVDGKHPFEEGHTVIVCSARSLHKVPDDWPTVMLCDECHNAGAKNYFESLLAFSKCFRFGFSATPLERSDNANILVSALFGPVVCAVSYQDAQEAGLVVPIEVEMHKVRCSYVPRQVDSARDRQNIWRNNSRNRQIAEIVSRYGPDSKVLILCSTIDHVFHLKRWLPNNFQPLYNQMDDSMYSILLSKKLITKDTPQSVDEAEMKAKFKKGKVTKVIATGMWSEGVDVADMEVIVRADAQTSTIFTTQSSGRVSRIFKNKKKGKVIDFYDEFYETYERRSKKRLKQYEKEGWEIIWKEHV